jgi:phage/plasmid-like protein (TIGR03299 family)
MSRETSLHLNTNTVIGNTHHRGSAWHYRAEDQGDESNHYPGPIPVADVERRLFHWQAESRPLAVQAPADLQTMTHLSEDGSPVRWTTDEGKQAICRSDRQDGSVMGIFTTGYAMHQYREWLLNTVASILDDDLSISSAGLLRDGALAWVEVSVPESITTPEGVTFRPNLLATTSFDGSISSTFKRTVTDTVCDNTRELALSEKGQQYKVNTPATPTRGSPKRVRLWP